MLMSALRFRRLSKEGEEFRPEFLPFNSMESPIAIQIDKKERCQLPRHKEREKIDPKAIIAKSLQDNNLDQLEPLGASQSKGSVYQTMLEYLHTIPMAKGEDGDIYIYSNGKFVQDDNSNTILGTIIYNVMRSYKIDLIYEEEFFHKLKSHLTRHLAKIWIRPPELQINLLNGILDLVTMKLQPHDALSWRSQIQFPLQYDPLSECPNWDSFLSNTFPDIPATFLWEAIGFCFTPKKLSQTALWFRGPGSNGKSTFGLALESLIGSANFLPVDFSQLDKDKFLLAELYGKLIALDPDVKKSSFQNSQNFKKIISNDLILAQRKNRDPFSFEPFSRVLAFGNYLPESADKSHGFSRRFLIIPMMKKFEAGCNGYKSQDKLISELSTASELSGAFRKGVEGLKRLSERGYFEPPPSIMGATAEFKLKQHPFGSFKKHHLVELPGEKVEKGLLLKEVNKYLLSNGHDEISIEYLGKLMGFYYPTLNSDSRIQDEDGSRKRAWAGIALN
jgi:P4 family phage/plasmid primase-like protien